MDSRSEAELRRRKILANAEARLKKIKRFTLKDIEPEIDMKNGDEQVNVYEDSGANRNEALPTLLNEFITTTTSFESKPLLNGGFHSDLTHPSDDQNPTVGEINFVNRLEETHVTQPQLFLDNKNVFVQTKNVKRKKNIDFFVFVILGVVIRLLYFIGLASVFHNNILGPFLLVCLPKTVLYLRRNPEFPRIYSIIVFLGVKESRIKVPFRIFCCLRTAIQYLALYLFSFFLTHSCIKEFNFS